MKKYKLTNANPLCKNLQEVENLMEKLGIVIYSHTPLYVLNTLDNKVYNLEEIDQNESVTSLPSTFEYKLTYEEI